MTTQNDTYRISRTSEFDTLTTDQKVTLEDIANLAFVGSEKVELAVNADNTWNMTSSYAFAEEIANTKGIELKSVKTGEVVLVAKELRPQ